MIGQNILECPQKKKTSFSIVYTVKKKVILFFVKNYQFSMDSCFYMGNRILMSFKLEILYMKTLSYFQL